jgi:hypothetical protein
MSTKAKPTKKPAPPPKKPPAAKPSTNPFVSAHASRLDRTPGSASKGSHRGGR